MHSLFTNHKFSYAFLNYFKVLLCFVEEQSGVHRIATKILLNSELFTFIELMTDYANPVFNSSFEMFA